MEQRSTIGGRFSAFLGARFSDVLQPEHSDFVSFNAIGGIGANRKLADAGVLNVLPAHISAVADYILSGRIKCEIAIVQLSPPDSRGRCSFATVSDYIVAACRKAGTVIAEINHSAPVTCGPHSLSFDEIDCIVETERPVHSVVGQAASDVDLRIAGHATNLIPDGAVIQVGIGAVPDAILSQLGGHRNLGIHSGMIGDKIVDLIEAGVITNALKSESRGVSVTGALVGTQRLYDFAHANPLISMQSTDVTHGASALANVAKLTSINSAIEVDLSGQVNAEEIGGRHLGAVGGAVDYVRGASRALGGRSIIALSSTTADAMRSKIVPALAGAVSTARSDVDVIVTEFGVADLRGRTLPERAEALVRIAHPAFRESLSAAAFTQNRIRNT
tara:strand:+ start:439 stop:1605 length:1167 start_codon:yes stop_codon:yes gene_type:complete